MVFITIIPFVTIGWPDADSSDCNKFYPGTCLEIGGSITFFWAARVAILGHALTDKCVFEVACLSALALDADGNKTPKTKENIVDPIGTAQEHGANVFDDF